MLCGCVVPAPFFTSCHGWPIATSLCREALKPRMWWLSTNQNCQNPSSDPPTSNSRIDDIAIHTHCLHSLYIFNFAVRIKASPSHLSRCQAGTCACTDYSSTQSAAHRPSCSSHPDPRGDINLYITCSTTLFLNRKLLHLQILTNNTTHNAHNSRPNAPNREIRERHCQVRRRGTRILPSLSKAIPALSTPDPSDPFAELSLLTSRDVPQLTLNPQTGNGVRQVHPRRLPECAPGHVREGVPAAEGLLSCKFHLSFSCISVSTTSPLCSDQSEVEEERNGWMNDRWTDFVF